MAETTPSAPAPSTITPSKPLSGFTPSKPESAVPSTETVTTALSHAETALEEVMGHLRDAIAAVSPTNGGDHPKLVALRNQVKSALIGVLTERHETTDRNA